MYGVWCFTVRDYDRMWNAALILVDLLGPADASLELYTGIVQSSQ